MTAIAVRTGACFDGLISLGPVELADSLVARLVGSEGEIPVSLRQGSPRAYAHARVINIATFS